MHVYDVKSEAGNPEHEPGQGGLIGQLSAKGGRTRAHVDLAIAVDYLRVLAGLALERRDLVTAERVAEQALSTAEQRRPIFEFLILLDRAEIWAAPTASGGTKESSRW